MILEKKLRVIFIVSFIIVVFFPSITYFLKIDPDVRTHEMLPSLKSYLTPEGFKKIPKVVQNFFDQNFGFRKQILDQKIAFETNILKSLRNPAVIEGKNNFIFYNPINVRDPLRDYKTIYFSQIELEKIKEKLDKENDWLKSIGVPYFILIPPDKEAAYPEFYPYPDHILTNIKLDQLINYLPGYSNITIIDLRKTIMKNKKPHQLIYYSGDTHWNQYGAFLGYQEVMREFSKINPNVYVPEISDFDLVIDSKKSLVGDIVQIANIAKNDGVEVVKIKAKPNYPGEYRKLGKAFIYGDSFTFTYTSNNTLMGMGAYFPFSFNEVVNGVFKDPLDHNKITKEKPDLIVKEIIQRNLRVLLGNEYSLFGTP